MFTFTGKINRDQWSASVIFEFLSVTLYVDTSKQPSIYKFTAVLYVKSLQSVKPSRLFRGI